MASSEKPWVVRDVPEHTRRLVKLYAVEHDMTMARAIEAIVDSVAKRRDRRVLDALMHVYRRVLDDDLEGAQREATTVQRLLEQPEEDD